MTRTARPLAAAALAVASLIGVTFAGAVLTHRIAIVATSGVSMNPVYYQGDLVVVHREDSYRIGDLVAYHRPDKDLVVLHRIVGGDAHGFVFKGDNNQSIDPTTPPQSQLVGRAVLHIAGGGLWFHRVTNPEVLAGLAFLLMGAGGTAAQTRRSRRTRRQHMTRHSAPTVRRTQLTPVLQAAAATSALVAVAGLALAAVGWSRTTMTTGHEQSDSGTATFSYRAQVPRTAAYDGTVVRSPDPVFRRLAPTVDVHLAYAGAPGSIAIRAEVSTASGWHTTLPLARRVEFTGRTYDADVTLDLHALDARARAAATATGMPAEQLNVRVVPDITPVIGPVFSPQLGLILTSLRLTLADGSALVVKGSTEPTRTVSRPRLQHLMGAAVPVSTVRTLSWMLLALAGVSGLTTLLLAARGTPASEAARIQRRYATMLLPVQPMPAIAGRPVIDVTEFTALVKLAERYGLLVLHWSRSDVDTYLVQDDTTTYRYRPHSAKAEASDLPAPERSLSS